MKVIPDDDVAARIIVVESITEEPFCSTHYGGQFEEQDRSSFADSNEASVPYIVEEPDDAEDDKAAARPQKSFDTGNSDQQDGATQRDADGNDGMNNPNFIQTYTNSVKSFACRIFGYKFTSTKVYHSYN